MWGPLSRRVGGLCLSLESPQGIRSPLHLVRWNMSLHLSLCRETRPSFESGHVGVHSTWGRKHRVPLTYLFLREGSSWGACGKFVYLFSRRQGIFLIHRRYGVHGTFLKLYTWWWSILETFVSGNLSSFLNGVKPLVMYDVDRGVFMQPMQGKLASSQFDPQTIWGARNIPQALYLMMLFTWDACLRESLKFPKGNQATCSVWWGLRGGYAANAR